MDDRADPLNRPTGARWWALLGILAVAELAWLAWYLIVPLPNAGNAQTTLPGGEVQYVPIRRWALLAEGIPYFIPGTGWHDSLLGGALDKLSHVEHLPQRFPIALAGLLIAASGMGLGLLAIRGLRLARLLNLTERLTLAFGLGLTGLGTITLGLGRLGGLAPWPIRVGLGLLAIAGNGWEIIATIRDRRAVGPSQHPKGHRARSLRAVVLFAMVAGPFLILMVLGSMQPSVDFDVLEYHLEGPKEWYLAGRIAFLPHNVYTTMPFNVEMLHLLGMVVLGDWWHGALAGQFLVMLHAPFAAAAIALAARRFGTPRAAWFAAVVYLTTPWIYRLSVFAYVEGPLGYYHAALILAAALAWSSSDHKPHSTVLALWTVAGALAGGAMACKYPALISAVLPFGLLAMAAGWRRRSWAIPMAFAVGVAVAVGPWLVKNVVDHGNPVYPLAYKVFGGHPWSPDREAKWSAAHGSRPITWRDLTAGLLDVAGRNDWQSPLYLAFAPLAFLKLGSRRIALLLWVYAAYVFATWWLLTHRLDRFWLPILPALAILAGLGADWSRRRAWSVLLTLIAAVSVATTWIYCTTYLAGFNQWTDDLDALRDDAFQSASPTLAWLDEHLPPQAKILLIGQAAVFHMRHEKIYNTVFDEEVFETLARGRTPSQVRHSLDTLRVTHVLVDWSEIARHRKPGGYGFTDFVQPEVFAQLVRAGVLEPIPGPGPGKDLYRVRGVPDPTRLPNAADFGEDGP